MKNMSKLSGHFNISYIFYLSIIFLLNFYLYNLNIKYWNYCLVVLDLDVVFLTIYDSYKILSKAHFLNFFKDNTFFYILHVTLHRKFLRSEKTLVIDNSKFVKFIYTYYLIRI